MRHRDWAISGSNARIAIGIVCAILYRVILWFLSAFGSLEPGFKVLMGLGNSVQGLELSVEFWMQGLGFTI